MLLDIQSPWFCHECQMHGSSFLTTKVRDDVSLPGASTIPSVRIPQHQKMRMNKPKSGKVKFLPASEAACLLPGDARNCLLPILTPVLKRSQCHGKTTSALRISSPVKPSAPVRDFCPLTKTRRGKHICNWLFMCTTMHSRLGRLTFCQYCCATLYGSLWYFRK